LGGFNFQYFIYKKEGRGLESPALVRVSLHTRLPGSGGGPGSLILSLELAFGGVGLFRVGRESGSLWVSLVLLRRF